MMAVVLVNIVRATTMVELPCIILSKFCVSQCNMCSMCGGRAAVGLIVGDFWISNTAGYGQGDHGDGGKEQGSWCCSLHSYGAVTMLPMRGSPTNGSIASATNIKVR